MIKKLREHVTTHSVWTFYDHIDSYSSFGDLLEELEHAQDGDMITLYMNSSGGSVAIGESLIRALNMTKAIVNCIIEASSWSMASIIALQCDNLYFNRDTFLMFHDYSTGYKGKGSEVTQMASVEKLNTDNQVKRWCTPFLTNKELTSIMNGVDVYIKWDDPTIDKRIKRHFGAKNAEKS